MSTLLAFSDPSRPSRFKSPPLSRPPLHPANAHGKLTRRLLDARRGEVFDRPDAFVQTDPQAARATDRSSLRGGRPCPGSAPFVVPSRDDPSLHEDG